MHTDGRHGRIFARFHESPTGERLQYGCDNSRLTDRNNLQDVRLLVVSISNPKAIDIMSLLAREAPASFRIVGDKTKWLCFIDTSGAIPERKLDECPVHIDVVHDPPAIYRPPHVVRIGGLPAVGMLPLVVDAVRNLLDKPDSFTSSTGVEAAPRRRPTNAQLNTLDALLKVTWRTLPPPIDEEFNRKAEELLTRLGSLLPSRKEYLLPLIRLCRPSSVNLTVVNPVPQPSSSAAIAKSSTHLPNRTRLPKPARNRSTKPARSISVAETKTQVIIRIAKEVVRILDRLGIKCALFGSMTCSLYGNERAPNVSDCF